MKEIFLFFDTFIQIKKEDGSDRNEIAARNHDDIAQRASNRDISRGKKADADRGAAAK